MLARLLRHLLLNYVHFIISIFVALQCIYKTFLCKIWLFEEEIVDETKYILDNVSKLKKKLEHLVIIVNYERQTLGDLARLVIWCLIAGVPFVSFYDVTGFLKENEEKLFLEVEKRKKGVPGRIKWSHQPDLNGYSNGIQPHKIVVNIFSNEDGRAQIAKCIRKIAEGEIHSQSLSNDYTAEELNIVMSSLYPKIPNPDLAVYSGHHCCTYGLLPWQIRLTEFIQLSIDNHVNIKHFIDVLYKYNKCDQRFGK